MCRYEMSAASAVEDTQRTRLCQQTDRQTDEQGETSTPLFNFVERRHKKNEIDKTAVDSGHRDALNTESQTRINPLIMDIHN